MSFAAYFYRQINRRQVVVVVAICRDQEWIASNLMKRNYRCGPLMPTFFYFSSVQVSCEFECNSKCISQNTPIIWYVLRTLYNFNCQKNGEKNTIYTPIRPFILQMYLITNSNCDFCEITRDINESEIRWQWQWELFINNE